jgi:HEAT repeat protein
MAAGAVLAGLPGCGPSTSAVVTGIKSENPAVRSDMVEFSKKFDAPEVVEALIGILADSDETTRVSAVKSLADIDDKLAAPALVDLLNTDPSPKVKREVVDALGRLKDPVAVEPLLALAEAGGDREIPLNIIWALGNIGDVRAEPLLSRLRQQSTDTYVVYNATVALRNVK